MEIPPDVIDEMRQLCGQLLTILRRVNGPKRVREKKRPRADPATTALHIVAGYNGKIVYDEFLQLISESHGYETIRNRIAKETVRQLVNASMLSIEHWRDEHTVKLTERGRVAIAHNLQRDESQNPTQIRV